MQVIGLEAANGSTKIVSKGMTEKYENRLERVFGREFNILGKNSQTVYEYEGQRFIISNKGTTSAGRNSKRYSTQEFLIENLIAIARVQKETDVILGTGLPCLDYLDEKARQAVKENLIGEHVIKVGDTVHNIKVHDVFIIPQPLGTLLDFMYDNELNIVNDRDKFRWLIIDIGRGTTDILLTDGLRAVKITGANIGSMDITNLYLEYINDKYIGTDYKFERSDVGANNDTSIRKYEQTFDFSKELDMAKKEIARRIMTFINDEGIDFSIADRIIYTGGTSLALQDYLQMNTNAKLYTYPELGNARGYHKFVLYKNASTKSTNMKRGRK